MSWHIIIDQFAFTKQNLVDGQVITILLLNTILLNLTIWAKNPCCRCPTVFSSLFTLSLPDLPLWYQNTPHTLIPIFSYSWRWYLLQVLWRAFKLSLSGPWDCHYQCNFCLFICPVLEAFDYCLMSQLFPLFTHELQGRCHSHLSQYGPACFLCNKIDQLITFSLLSVSPADDEKLACIYHWAMHFNEPLVKTLSLPTL